MDPREAPDSCYAIQRGPISPQFGIRQLWELGLNPPALAVKVQVTRQARYSETPGGTRKCVRLSLPEEVATLRCRRVVESQLLLQDFSQNLQLERLVWQAAFTRELYGLLRTAFDVPQMLGRSLLASAVGGASGSLQRYPRSFLESRDGTGDAVYRLPTSRD